ncbi:MAG: protein kinase [Pirellulales bacterium]|nr:protein kinase [Pirellulales bacterium]
MNSQGRQVGSELGCKDNHTAFLLVTQAISTWRGGSSPDALAFLQAHPQLAEQKSLVLDLAYEEYCLRKEHGESVTPSRFCDKFPDLRRSLTRLLDVHEYLDHHPEFTPLEEKTKWPQPGDDFSGFEIERKIGSGAFARVYVAHDPSLGYRPVTLKVSRAGASEAMTLGRLTHEGIVPVNSVKEDTETGLAVICMPYQGEATLVDLLEAGFTGGGRPQNGDIIFSVARHRAISAVEKVERPNVARRIRASYVDAVVWLAAQLADALKYAHSRGVLHRDLKPSNVLLAPDGRPKLLDFNLSWDTELSSAQLGGTVPYMSPEQVKSVLLGAVTDRRGGIDQRSDLFSLGVVLYELLTGTTPFGNVDELGHEREDAEVLLKRQKRGPVPLEELNPDVDPSLGEIVASCLEFDPADRPQSATELEAALMRYQRPVSRLWRLMRRRKWMIWSISLATVLAVAVAGAWLANRPPTDVRASRAGFECYELADWKGATEYWTKAIEADGSRAELLFARAMANLQRGEYLSADADLRLVLTLSNSGAIRAALAYCSAYLGKVPSGIGWSKESIKKGFKNAAVYNNLGYFNLLRGMPKEAVENLNQAIALDSQIAVAYHNRALARLPLVGRDRTLLPAIVQDIETALKLAPDQWPIQRDAARIFAQFARQYPDHRQKVMRCLSKLVEHGGSLLDIRAEPCFDSVRGLPEFAELSELSQPAHAIEPPRVVLPCSDARLP